MPTAEKTAAIEQLQQTMDKAAAIFLADFTGLNVEQMTDLRRKFRAEGVGFEVVKNTLAIKACRALEFTDLEEHLKGPTAMATALEDPASPARILVDFRKEHDKPQVKLAYIDGKVLSPEDVEALSRLPTRDQLISQVMQLAQAPAQGFVGVLNAVLSELVRTVDAVRDGMEKGTVKSAAPAPAKAEDKEGGVTEAVAEESTKDQKTDQSEEVQDGE